MTEVAEVIADWVAGVNPRVYSLCGAGAMHLNDAFCHHPKIEVTATHHEQAATFAAEADARVSGRPGIVQVTAGPGGTNTITGIASAYVDSIPLIVIAGQATSSTLKPHGLRQLGMNELDLVAMVKPITKYAVTVTNAKEVLWQLDYALHIATTGRPGPVWVEIPLDIQAAEVDADKLERLLIPAKIELSCAGVVTECYEMLEAAKRPVLLIGNGVRLGKACEELDALSSILGIPVVSSWGAADILPSGCAHYIGRCGLFGDRASNFAVQKADLILAIGTRLSFPQIGHAPQLFAPKAKKIVVDIDAAEASKRTINADLICTAGAKEFLRSLLIHLHDKTPGNAHHLGWLHQCQKWKLQHPVMREEYRQSTDGVNAYHFVEELGRHLPNDAIVVTDVGFSFIPTMQALQLKEGQRLFHSGGVSAMGYGLPAAIGACRAGKGRKVVCLTGDGGIMLNLQELQTIAHYRLPISIVVFANGGYATIQMMQDNHFKRRAISSATTGVTCPYFGDLAIAFGLEFDLVRNHDLLAKRFPYHLSLSRPSLVQLNMAPDQALAPRVQSRIEDGHFVPTSIEHMWPPIEVAADRVLEPA